MSDLKTPGRRIVEDMREVTEGRVITGCTTVERCALEAAARGAGLTCERRGRRPWRPRHWPCARPPIFSSRTIEGLRADGLLTGLPGNRISAGLTPRGRKTLLLTATGRQALRGRLPEP